MLPFLQSKKIMRGFAASTDLESVGWGVNDGVHFLRGRGRFVCTGTDVKTLVSESVVSVPHPN